MPNQKKRRPAKESLTYYRTRNASGLYWQEYDSSSEWGPMSSARLYSTRAKATFMLEGCVVEPVRVTPLRGAKNRKRTR